MISRSTLTIMMIALSSVSAQNVRFVPAGQPVTNVTPFGINNRLNVPTTFNGLSGFNTAFANGNLLNAGFNGLNGFNSFNGLNSLNGINNLSGFQGVNLTNGLTSLGNLGAIYGLDGNDNFSGLNGTIVTNDGTFIRSKYDNYRYGGYVDEDFYNNSRIRYAGEPDTSRNGQVIARAIPTPVDTAVALACINRKCNTESFLVCGANSRTYRNLCQLNCYGIDFARDGQCFAN